MKAKSALDTLEQKYEGNCRAEGRYIRRIYGTDSVFNLLCNAYCRWKEGEKEIRHAKILPSGRIGFEEVDE